MAVDAQYEKLRSVADKVLKLYKSISKQNRALGLAIVEKVTKEFQHAVAGTSVEYILKEEDGNAVTIPHRIFIHHRYQVPPDRLKTSIMRIAKYFQEAVDASDDNFAERLYGILKGFQDATGTFAMYWVDVKEGKGYRPVLYIEFSEVHDDEYNG